MINNNTTVKNIPESLIMSGNVPHPADHPELFEMSGDAYVYIGPDDFVETVKPITVTDGKLIAADPCYADAEYEDLCVFVDNVQNGTWTVDYCGPNLRAINNEYKIARFKAGEDQFMEWSDAIGLIGVDTGLAGFFTDPDADLFNKESDGFDYRFTLRGDGCYPVLMKEIDGEVVALEINYESGSIFNYHHGIVTSEDQQTAIVAVEAGDWDTYSELAEKYNRISGECPCFPPAMFIGYGCLPLTEESLGLAEHCEFETG